MKVRRHPLTTRGTPGDWKSTPRTPLPESWSTWASKSDIAIPRAIGQENSFSHLLTSEQSLFEAHWEQEKACLRVSIRFVYLNSRRAPLALIRTELCQNQRRLASATLDIHRKSASPAEVELRRVRIFQERPERPFPRAAKAGSPSLMCDFGFGHWSKQMYHWSFKQAIYDIFILASWLKGR